MCYNHCGGSIMESILKTEIKRLIDILSALNNHTNFDAYIEKLKEPDKLKYPELKYYLEQIQDILAGYDDYGSWHDERKAVEKSLKLLEKVKAAELAFTKETEPLKQFWKSFKLWTEEELPSLNILKSYYIKYSSWNGGTYFLEINMPSEFTKMYGLDCDDRFEKEFISFRDLKMYIELFYDQFVENRYEYTKIVNKNFAKFRLPYKLTGGKIIKKGYKTSETNPKIINYPMLESKIIWSEDKILGLEKLDKHTALNYITDSLEFILSLIKDKCAKGRDLDQKCAFLISDDDSSKIYSVIKTEVSEIQKIVNEYFDIRHNEYINKAKENRESLENSVFIEYLYNRIYSLLFLLKAHYSKTITTSTDDSSDEDLPF